MNSYIISTERLGLRKWKDSDILPFAGMNRDPEVMKYFPGTFSEAETRSMVKRIQSHFDRNRFGLFAVELKTSGEFIGFTGFSIPAFESFFTPCVEIGWRYKKEFWGKGYAAEAARACLTYGFETLQLEKIVSFTSPLNINSEKLMKRIGMNYLGDFDHPLIQKDHVLCRHVLYEIIR
jgi:[ribosomal protein S5]-alanine N-acetyltransferase